MHVHVRHCCSINVVYIFLVCCYVYSNKEPTPGLLQWCNKCDHDKHLGITSKASFHLSKLQKLVILFPLSLLVRLLIMTLSRFFVDECLWPDLYAHWVFWKMFAETSAPMVFWEMFAETSAPMVCLTYCTC